MWQAIIIVVFVVALASCANYGDGWFWEVGNGLGFLALALLFVLTFHGRSGLGLSIRHRWLGQGTLLITLGHCLWFLIGDPVSWEYLKWGAPHYMSIGLSSLALMLVLTLTSLRSFRHFSYDSHAIFRSWHRYMAVAILVTALLHVVLSGFYIVTSWQSLLLVGVAVVAFYLSTWSQLDASFARWSLVIVSLLFLVLFYLVRLGLPV